MAVRTHVEKPITYSSATAEKPSFISYWLTGFLILMVLALAISVVNATTQFPRDGIGADAPMVLPEASTMPGSTIRDGRSEALDNIAGVPSTDRLPGRDDRRPQPVPAPL